MTTRHIDSLESFDINGLPQWVLQRGNLATRRVLLIVQQGPGFPLIQDARVFEQNLHLETEGVVAYWDQRGTGKSFRADPSTINLAHSVSDVRAIVDALCARLKVDRVPSRLSWIALGQRIEGPALAALLAPRTRADPRRRQ